MALAARLHLLGEFALVLDGRPHPVPASARRLLALLAVLHRGRRVSRTALAETLRPDSDPSRATSTLRSVLWRLPRERGRALVLGDAVEVWVHPELEVDLWQAEAQAQALCSRDAPVLDDATDLSLLGRDLLRVGTTRGSWWSRSPSGSAGCTRSSGAPTCSAERGATTTP